MWDTGADEPGLAVPCAFTTVCPVLTVLSNLSTGQHLRDPLLPALDLLETLELPGSALGLELSVE